MNEAKFKATIARLEAESEAAPTKYKLKVAALAVLGFVILAMLLGTVGLGILLLAAFVIAVVMSGGTVLLFVLKLGKLLVLIVVPMWFMVRYGLQAMFVRVPVPEGEPITKEQAPALFAALADMRRRMRGPKFHRVLIIDDVNAAVVQRPLFGLIGFQRNYLLLGLPLLESLPADEALAVVAHEYGHLAGSHGRFGAWIYRLRNSWGTIQAVTEQMQGWLAALVRPLVSWYAPHFNAYTFVLARANEYEADAASAELVGAAAASRALKRVNLVAPRYQAFLAQTAELMREQAQPPRDASERWAKVALVAPAPEEAKQWLNGALDHETHFADTHPVLRARLTALARQAPQLEDLQALPPPPTEPSAAEAWLGSALPALRRALGKAWATRIAEPWQARHAELQRDLQRRAELRDAPTRSPEETFELLRLQTQLDIKDDQRAAWAAFNAEHPEHAGGLFFEGAERLHYGDAGGLALLERAMALDPELTKPACERAHEFLTKQKDPAAEQFAERWRARDAQEQATMRELHQMQPGHQLVAAEPEVLETARRLLRGDVLEHVAEVYVARRVLPSAPQAPTYAVGVKLTWWGRTRGRQGRVVDRIVKLDWPVHVYVFAFEGVFAGHEKRLRKLAGSRVV